MTTQDTLDIRPGGRMGEGFSSRAMGMEIQIRFWATRWRRETHPASALDLDASFCRRRQKTGMQCSHYNRHYTRVRSYLASVLSRTSSNIINADGRLFSTSINRTYRMKSRSPDMGEAFELL